MTAAEVLAAIDRAAADIFTDDERALMSISVVRSGADGVPLDEEVLERDHRIVVAVLDEEAHLWVNPEETALQLFVRARSDLQDFVAESRFGWGQLRG